MGFAVLSASRAPGRPAPSFTPVRADSVTRCGPGPCTCGCSDHAEEEPVTRSAPGHDFDRVAVSSTREPYGISTDDEDVTQAPEASPEPVPMKEEEKKPPAKSCKVASGPTYSPTGDVPVTTSGGKKKAKFTMAATFTKDAAAGHDASCCEVRQYIKWDKAYEDDKGGPPHSGFGSGATHGTWYEDRDKDDKRYGHRSGTHSDPVAGCGDEYKTGDTQDQAKGNKYCGSDGPESVETRKGQYQFQLKVIDTCNADAEKASSSVITIKWG